MKPTYQFKIGAHISGDAQKVGERLEAIRIKNDGLTPTVVLNDARQESSVLHGYFEWDDSLAAEKYRLDQAGHLIRCVTVVYPDQKLEADPRQISLESVPAVVEAPRSVRAFVAVKRDGERLYESTERAMGDDEMRRQVLAQAHDELASVGRKYRELQELAGVFLALDQVASKLREPIAA